MGKGAGLALGLLWYARSIRDAASRERRPIRGSISSPRSGVCRISASVLRVPKNATAIVIGAAFRHAAPVAHWDEPWHKLGTQSEPLPRVVDRLDLDT